MAFEHKTETEARQQILDMVAEYCDTYHNKKGPFQEGDRIPYASRVYDHKEDGKPGRQLTGILAYLRQIHR